MAKNSATAPDSVTVRCYTFSNPESINGPYGTFQLWVNGSNIVGRMTQNTLFELGSTSLLNLQGTFSGTDPIVCELQGTGFVTQEIGAFKDPVVNTTSFTLTLSADWSTGTIGTAPFQLSAKSAPCPSLADEKKT